MVKQTLMVSVVALGFVTGAFAGSLMEQPVPAPIAISSNDAGYYVGLEAGLGYAGWKNLNNFSSMDVIRTTDDDSWVGRVFVGYDFNKYFAVETGYTYFGEKSEFAAAMNSGRVFVPYTVRTQVIDLVGKAKAPLTDDISIYAKLGPAYQQARMSHELFSGDQIYATSPARNVNRIVAAFGAGVDYTVTPNIVINAEWLNFSGNQHVRHNYMPSANVYMIGASYKFDR